MLYSEAHRAHASISGMAEFFQVKAAGLLMQKEFDYLFANLLVHPEKTVRNDY